MVEKDWLDITAILAQVVGAAATAAAAIAAVWIALRADKPRMKVLVEYQSAEVPSRILGRKLVSTERYIVFHVEHVGGPSTTIRHIDLLSAGGVAAPVGVLHLDEKTTSNLPIVVREGDVFEFGVKVNGFSYLAPRDSWDAFIGVVSQREQVAGIQLRFIGDRSFSWKGPLPQQTHDFVWKAISDGRKVKFRRKVE